MNYFLVVIYNKKCFDSSSLTRLLNWNGNKKIIVYDNSTKEFDNDIFCKEHGILYLTQHKNVGLSKAYNYSIENLHFGEDDYFITLDDDTELTDEYFSEIEQKTNSKVADILVPIVMANNRILSPNNLVDGCRSKTVENINEIQAENLTAINSGVAIRGRILKEVQYNDNLFLDYVDHDFFKKLHEIHATINIMNSCIFQNYSREEKTTLESANHRFRIYCQDYKAFCSNANKPLIYYLFTIKQVVKLTASYHSLSFIKILVRSGKDKC